MSTKQIFSRRRSGKTGRKENKMEVVKYYVNRISPDMCRIVPHDIRSMFKHVPGAGGGCICSLEVMLDTMEQITKGCSEIGYAAVFEM